MIFYNLKDPFILSTYTNVTSLNSSHVVLSSLIMHKWVKDFMGTAKGTLNVYLHIFLFWFCTRSQESYEIKWPFWTQNMTRSLILFLILPFLDWEWMYWNREKDLRPDKANNNREISLNLSESGSWASSALDKYLSRPIGPKLFFIFSPKTTFFHIHI